MNATKPSAENNELRRAFVAEMVRKIRGNMEIVQLTAGRLKGWPK
jgi:hypothetical protein